MNAGEISGERPPGRADLNFSVWAIPFKDTVLMCVDPRSLFTRGHWALMGETGKGPCRSLGDVSETVLLTSVYRLGIRC